MKILHNSVIAGWMALIVLLLIVSALYPWREKKPIRPKILWVECHVQGQAKYQCLDPESIRTLLAYTERLEASCAR